MGQATAADWIVAVVAVLGFIQSLAALAWNGWGAWRDRQAKLGLDVTYEERGLWRVRVSYKADRSRGLGAHLKVLDLPRGGLVNEAVLEAEQPPSLRLLVAAAREPMVGGVPEMLASLSHSLVAPASAEFLLNPAGASSVRIRLCIRPLDRRRPLICITRTISPHA